VQCGKATKRNANDMRAPNAQRAQQGGGVIREVSGRIVLSDLVAIARVAVIERNRPVLAAKGVELLRPAETLRSQAGQQENRPALVSGIRWPGLVVGKLAPGDQRDRWLCRLHWHSLPATRGAIALEATVRPATS
jgi:hypothetical protein